MFKIMNEEMHNVWNLYAVQMYEKKFSYHHSKAGMSSRKNYSCIHEWKGYYSRFSHGK